MQESNTSRLIIVEDIYELRDRKQAELEFYNRELIKLQQRMNYIRLEMDLTNRIIDMIERESIVDLRTTFMRKNGDS